MVAQGARVTVVLIAMVGSPASRTISTTRLVIVSPLASTATVFPAHIGGIVQKARGFTPSSPPALFLLARLSRLSAHPYHHCPSSPATSNRYYHFQAYS